MIARLKKIDTVMLVIFILLVLLGAATLLSASFAQADLDKKNPYFFFMIHVRHLGFGLAAVFFLYFVPYQLWVRLYWLLALAAIFCLVLPLISTLSEEVNKTLRWSPYLMFQPSEVSKLAVVCVLAYYFSHFSHKVRDFRYGVLFPVLLMLSVAGLIYLGKDLGGSVIVCGIVFLMMVLGGVGVRWLVLMCGLLVFATYRLAMVVKYRSDRLVGWDNPWGDPSGTGLQIVQSLYAFANGGVAGAGPGQSQQKLFFLPEAFTDYIFAILGEEFGLIGVLLTAFLFLAFAGRGFVVARAAKNMSGFYLAAGMTLCVAVPAFLNMFVALSILPPKGLPLPFFSYGGSSMVVSCAAVGIILAVASQSREEKKPAQAGRPAPEPGGARPAAAPV
jgi:cell division protein FtsW